MKSMLIFLSLFMCWQVQASRIVEIEDYYSAKTSDFIKTRYPRAAFTVYVTVEAENKPQLREPATNKNYLNLPFLQSVSADDVSFWDRQDVSLGTLISYLRSVNIKVDIDQSFSSAEREQFKSELFRFLKLSETFDRIDVTEKQWTAGGAWQSLKKPLAAGLLGLLGLSLALFVIFHNGVRQLVKGLSQPLSEIGRSAENVANSSKIPTDLGGGLTSSQSWNEGQVSAEHLAKAKDDIQRLSDFLSEPDANLIYKLEELGEADPEAMGSIFSEMPVESLKKLVVWSKGEWWRKALTQMAPISQKSLKFLNEISLVNIRKSLLEGQSEKNTTELEKLLARLSVKQFGELLQKKPFNRVEALLRLLPQERMIRVAKYLYPGEWAQLLNEKSVELSSKEIKDFSAQAQTICPLKTENEIASYFKEGDLQSLLDQSSTKDEREIYRALPDDSWVKTHRKPFYSLFQESEALLESLATEMPLELWGLCILDCDREELDKLYQFFTAKQKFILRGLKEKFKQNPPSHFYKSQAKKRIMVASAHIKKQLERKDDSGAEVAA